MVLDCDTGTDDAIAIMLAALHPGLDLLGVTAVQGNVDVEHAADNSLRVLDLVGRSDVPVLRGVGRPLSTAPDAEAHRRQLPLHLPVASSPRVADAGAVEWLVETLRGSTEPVTVVPTGPLTNLAQAVVADPAIVNVVEEVVVMGGGHAVGNVTPSADRNVWWDAAAAEIVLRAGFLRPVLVTLDATHQALLDRDDCARLRGLGTAAGEAAATLVEERIGQYAGSRGLDGREAAPVHDPLTVAYLLDPGVVRLEHLHVAVERTGALTYGRTVIDRHRVTDQPPNAFVALSSDSRRYVDVLLRTLG